MLPKFRLQLFGEFGEVDNHPLVRCRSDLLNAILRLDLICIKSRCTPSDYRRIARWEHE